MRRSCGHLFRASIAEFISVCVIAFLELYFAAIVAYVIFVRRAVCVCAHIFLAAFAVALMVLIIVNVTERGTVSFSALCAVFGVIASSVAAFMLAYIVFAARIAFMVAVAFDISAFVYAIDTEIIVDDKFKFIVFSINCCEFGYIHKSAFAVEVY